jgi:hypothetical protein
LFAESLMTVAVKSALVPAGTSAESGVIEILMTVPVTLNVVEADAEPSLCEVAVMVTTRSPIGGAAGAV